jgi:hypothetical protein
MPVALLNLTDFQAETLAVGAGMTVVVKGTFLASPTRSTPCEEHLPLAGADLPSGDPEELTSARYESDFAPFKPSADALCVGKAYPPRGGPQTECLIGFGVGSWFNVIRVLGNRRWIPSLGGLSHRMTEPEPFKSIVVSFDHAFGGKDAGKPDGFQFYAPNPVGKGYSAHGGGLNDLPLPNLEDPNDPIKSWRSHPRPMSFGPVGRTWEPRLRRAGTYDKNWLKHRSPKLPEDFQEAFYNCAPEDQQIPGYLRGDEEVRVQNMHPEHSDFRCRLPGIRVRALLDRTAGARNQFEEITMNLDTLWMDMEALQMVLVWRGRILAAVPEGQGPVLIVEEPLNSAPRPAESYRPELAKHAAEEQEAEKAVEEAEKELEQMEKSEAGAMPADPGEK